MAGPELDTLDPDEFLKQALEKKLEAINQRIEALLASGKTSEEAGRLITARARFSEVLRSPRLYLARPAGSEPSAAPAPGQAAAPSPSPAPPTAASPAPATPTKSFLPLGAIPQPRRVGAPAEPPPAAWKQAAPTPHVTSPANGMMGFLKSVQAGAASSAPAAQPGAAASPSPAPNAPTARPPAIPSPTPGGGMMSFLKSVQGAQAGPSSPSPAPSPAPDTTPPEMASPSPAAPTPQPSPAPVPSPPTPSPSPSGKGQMLSFLEKVRGAGDESSPQVRTQDALPAIERSAILHDLKERAASSGFKDIYEMLRFKRLRLVESRARLMQSDDATAKRVTLVLDREINEIDSLLKQRPDEIVRKVEEFGEVAAVDKGGLAAIKTELQGLLDEIK